MARIALKRLNNHPYFHGDPYKYTGQVDTKNNSTDIHISLLYVKT